MGGASDPDASPTGLLPAAARATAGQSRSAMSPRTELSPRRPSSDARGDSILTYMAPSKVDADCLATYLEAEKALDHRRGTLVSTYRVVPEQVAQAAL